MKTRTAWLILVLSFTAALAEPTGKPQYGAWGFDTEGADLKTKPGDDFFLAKAYANSRTLRLADGPDEVHHMVVGRAELSRH